MIHAHAEELFPAMAVRGCYQFRLTRNADLSVDPEEVSDLASALRGELLARRYGSGVRLEVADNLPGRARPSSCFGSSSWRKRTSTGSTAR